MESAKIVMFFPKCVYASVDIKGKIATDGTYEEIVHNMKDIFFLDEMRELVEKINYNNYGRNYIQNTYSLTQQFTYDSLCDMNDKYESKYGTTWLFIKNLSGKSLKISTIDKSEYLLLNNELGILYYGMSSEHLANISTSNRCAV